MYCVGVGGGYIIVGVGGVILPNHTQTIFTSYTNPIHTLYTQPGIHSTSHTNPIHIMHKTLCTHSYARTPMHTLLCLGFLHCTHITHKPCTIHTLASSTVHTSLAWVQNSTLITTAPHNSAMQKNKENVQCSTTLRGGEGGIRCVL